MEVTLALLAILGALTVGVVSPGPSFVLVVRTAVAVSRRDGIAAALGMGLGGVIFGGFALLGLHAVLMRVEWLYVAFRVAGGLYLVYLAWRLWRGAAEPIAVAAMPARSGNLPGTFLVGLATQLSNPKTAIVYASVFAAFLPPALPGWTLIVLPLLIFVIESAWYIVVALAFSAEQPRAAYLRAKLWLDRLAGSVMGVLGLRLVVEASRP